MQKRDNPIFSTDLELHVISGLLKFPNLYSEVAFILNKNDFYNDFFRTTFEIIKHLKTKQEEVSPFIVAERITSSGATFKDIKNIQDTLTGISLRIVSEKEALQAVKDLKKVTVRREIFETAANIATSMKKEDGSKSFAEIVSMADNLYYKRMSTYEIFSETVDIYEGAESEIFNIEPEDGSHKFLYGPHQRINDIYGSLYRPNNISVICARSGSYKTAWMIDYADKVGAKYAIPVLHLDNGEMSKEEILHRRISSIADIPVYYIETGEWKRNPKMVEKIKSAMEVIKSRKFYYYNVGGMDIEQILSLIRNFYYTKVGRFTEQHKFILNLDYIKITEGSRDRQEHQIAGDMMVKFKNFLMSEVPVGMMTALQANRSGTVTNKTEDQVIDDETIASMSDRIIQNCSHFAILRRKTNDQLARENQEYGTLMMKFIKCRAFGQHRDRHFNLVEFQNKLMQNYINFSVNNFNIQEEGDFHDVVSQIGQVDITLTDEEEPNAF
jgi:replicative DNA helicase